MKVIPLGKYRGRMFASIARVDPHYLNWMILTFTGELRDAADQALSRSGPSKSPSLKNRSARRQR